MENLQTIKLLYSYRRWAELAAIVTTKNRSPNLFVLDNTKEMHCTSCAMTPIVYTSILHTSIPLADRMFQILDYIFLIKENIQVDRNHSSFYRLPWNVSFSVGGLHSYSSVLETSSTMYSYAFFLYSCECGLFLLRTSLTTYFLVSALLELIIQKQKKKKKNLSNRFARAMFFWHFTETFSFRIEFFFKLT